MSGYVYAIDAGNAVKIGWASNPRRRLSELNVASPKKYSLLGVVSGTREDEAAAHVRCQSERIRGEWFTKRGPVVEFLQSLIPFPKPRHVTTAAVSRVSFREIIDQIGSSALAKALAVEESHVRVMKARDSIPPEYWGVVIDESAARGIEGITHEALRNLRGTRFNRSEDAA